VEELVHLKLDQHQTNKEVHQEDQEEVVLEQTMHHQEDQEIHLPYHHHKEIMEDQVDQVLDHLDQAVEAEQGVRVAQEHQVVEEQEGQEFQTLLFQEHQ
jgi:glutamyl/glutaminyl-tRNA synthetase